MCPGFFARSPAAASAHAGGENFLLLGASSRDGSPQTGATVSKGFAFTRRDCAFTSLASSHFPRCWASTFEAKRLAAAWRRPHSEGTITPAARSSTRRLNHKPCGPGPGTSPSGEVPERSAAPFLAEAKDARDLSVEDLRDDEKRIIVGYGEEQGANGLDTETEEEKGPATPLFRMKSDPRRQQLHNKLRHNNQARYKRCRLTLALIGQHSIDKR